MQEIAVSCAIFDNLLLNVMIYSTSSLLSKQSIACRLKHASSIANQVLATLAFLLVASFSLAVQSVAQCPMSANTPAGTNDSCFTAFDNGTRSGYNIRTTLAQPDGKVLVGGMGISGLRFNKIARLNINGTLDSSFDPGNSFNIEVTTIALQADGKVFVGGSTGGSTSKVARLNANGTLDATFSSGTGFNNEVYSLALQPDGKLLVGGSFTTYNGLGGRNYLMRLNVDGTIDASFNASLNIGNNGYAAVSTIALQTDSRIIVGGIFTRINGTMQNRIARLNVDGTLDASFNTGAGFDNAVASIVLQPNGKILVGGSFTSFQGFGRNYIARLNSNGSIDASFNQGGGFDDYVNTMALQQDGKVIAGGLFTTFGGTARSNIARLNANGNLDSSFDPGSGFYDFSAGTPTNVSVVALHPEGKVMVCGDFTRFNGYNLSTFVCLDGNGALDRDFYLGKGFDNRVMHLVIQPDRKVIAGGSFNYFNGISRKRMARLNEDGTLDATFSIGTGFNNDVRCMVLQPDGKVIVGGYFDTFNGVNRNHIVRLNQDGSLDASFNLGTGFDSVVFSLAIQPDGKVIVGGKFKTFNGVGRSNIARLNSNGTLDGSFNPIAGFNGFVYNMVLQPDGKVITGGSFTTFNGIGRKNIARLNSNGALDPSFDPGSGFDAVVYSLVLQRDGKLISGGNFTTFNGSGRSKLARLNADGTLDASFNPGASFNNFVLSMALQPDGKLVVSGYFYSATHVRIARLNSNGTIDALFNSGLGFDYDPATCFALQLDGKVVVGGIFQSYNGKPKSYISRIIAFSPCVIVPPTVTIGSVTTFCSGRSVTLTAPAGFTYLWNNGATTQSIAVTASGSYTVQTIAASCTSAASAATVVTVTSPPAQPSISANSPTTFCSGGSVILSAPTGFTYLWSNGDTTQSINVRNSGSYSLQTIARECTSAVSVPTVITVDTMTPSTPILTASGPTTFCDGGSVTLSAPAGFRYFWSTGANSQSISVIVSITCYVQLIAGACSSATSTPIVVKVNSLPDVPIISQNGNTLQSNYQTGNQWLLNNTPIAGQTGVTFVPTASDTYSVSYTDSNGCKSTSVGFAYTLVGLGSKISSFLKLIPNPTKGIAHISGLNGRSQIIVLDALGRLILNKVATTKEFDLDLSALQAGIYVVSANGQSIRVVKH